MNKSDQRRRDLSGRRKIEYVGSSGPPSTGYMALALGLSKPEKIRKKYLVCQCPSCGRVQVTQAKEFVCKHCLRRAKYVIRGTQQVKIAETDNPEKAVRFCRHWMACNRQGITSLQKIKELFIVRSRC